MRIMHAKKKKKKESNHRASHVELEVASNSRNVSCWVTYIKFTECEGRCGNVSYSASLACH